MSPWCRAIAERRLLAFHYDGRARVVECYCHGTSTAGHEVLRAVEHTGRRFGKLWRVEKIEGARVLDTPYVASDPSYNPNDSAMATIHCRV